MQEYVTSAGVPAYDNSLRLQEPGNTVVASARVRNKSGATLQLFL
jgi:hypothetical protein